MKITSTKKKDRMKAVVYEKFGTPEVLKIKDVPKPGLKKNEVLVRILASTVSIEDPRMRSAEFDWPLILRIIGGLILGFKKPKKQVLGIEFAGTIEQVGQNVIRLKKGDHVYGYTGIGLGAHAQFKCMPEKGIIALKPTNMTFAESAAIPNGALTSLVYLRKKGRIRKGEHVLINGASGAVGTAAVQLAKFYGAKVTGVCSETNLELGETFEETALREAKEEVGILLGTLTLLGIYSGKEMYYEYPNGDKIYNVVVAYSTNEYSGELFEEVYIEFAESVAKRSTCKRLQVGTVITTTDFRKVLAIGYNGNATGLENKCDSDTPGNCGCLHSEENATINCDSPRNTEKYVFVTHLPCTMCAKRLLNLGVGYR